jgi:twitching motility protein PilT
MSASELFLTSTQRPAVRIHGHLVDLPAAPMPFEQVKEMVFTALTPAQQADYARAKHVETGLELPGAGRFTAGIFRHFLGIAGVFHVVPEAPWVFERLGLPATARRIAQYSHGLVLITGPLGSGKSATLSAYVEMINREQPLHIITIESPIEVLYQSDRSLISQREVGRHTASYADALRAALREDPDVIAVGELTDPDSTATALQAAETGHLVFATMTTSNAHRTIVRLLDQFPSHKRAQIRAMLANTLRAVVSQQLVPNLDGRGRSLAYELLFANAAVSNLIREDRIWQIPMVMQVAGPQGMRLMDDTLRELVGARRISLADALARATDKDRMLPR